MGHFPSWAQPCSAKARAQGRKARDCGTGRIMGHDASLRPRPARVPAPAHTVRFLPAVERQFSEGRNHGVGGWRHHQPPPHVAAAGRWQESLCGLRQGRGRGLEAQREHDRWMA